MIKPSLLICVLAATLVGNGQTSRRPKKAGQQPTEDEMSGLVLNKPVLHKKDIAAIAKEANGAVVSIVMSDKKGHPVAQGSGFFINHDGYVVTNYHVIKSGSLAVIKIPDGAFVLVDGVLAFDKNRDIAVIKAHGNDFRMLPLGDSDQLRVGDEVVAIGSPLSLEATVSNGIVSGIRHAEGNFLQTTAPISPGSSGGPLFNMVGEVIGITTARLEGGENLNFAIPINAVKQLVARSSNVSAFPDEIESAIETEPKTEPKRATFDQQKACADQARIKFVDEKYAQEYVPYTRNRRSASYTSHYNAQTNVCYLAVMSVTTLEDKHYALLTKILIYDAFEGHEYAGLGVLLNSGFPSISGTPLDPSECWVSPAVGQPNIKCSTESEDEFDALIKKYFDINWR